MLADITIAEAIAAVTRVAAVYDASFREGEMAQPIPILGPTRVKQIIAQEWALRHNAADVFVNTLIPLYWQIAPQYDLPAENAAMQSAHETGWAHFGGVLDTSFRNPAGIKTKSGGGNFDPNAHYRFPSWEAGVQAHCSHLSKYGGLPEAQMPAGHYRSPRLVHVTQGIAPNIRDLGGKYAPSPTYGLRLETNINDLLEFAKTRNGQEQPVAAQIPGFQWLPAAQTHFTRGRTQSIRGYAQHYTAGTDSRAWLTHTSRPPVSSTFLIKHNPTLQDRGWQLVRIEDTAWTTAFANPYTVSCEYEHRGTGTIPDIAYTVMAQTILDTAKYVADKQLGYIPLNREGIKGHREWTGGGTICPDGISMDRLVGEVQKLQAGDKPVSTEIELNGFRIIGGFKGRWESLGPLALSTLGYPESDEFTASVDGVERTVQLFERGILAWYPEGIPHGVAPDDPMHVRTLTLAESIALGKQWTQNARNLR